MENVVPLSKFDFFSMHTGEREMQFGSELDVVKINRLGGAGGNIGTRPERRCIVSFPARPPTRDGPPKMHFSPPSPNPRKGPLGETPVGSESVMNTTKKEGRRKNPKDPRV